MEQLNGSSQRQNNAGREGYSWWTKKKLITNKAFEEDIPQRTTVVDVQARASYQAREQRAYPKFLEHECDVERYGDLKFKIGEAKLRWKEQR